MKMKKKRKKNQKNSEEEKEIIRYGRYKKIHKKQITQTLFTTKLASDTKKQCVSAMSSRAMKFLVGTKSAA